MNKILKQLLLVVPFLLSSFVSSAGMRSYSGTLENSKWQVSQKSRLQCQLTHNIPNYGEALFVSEANKISNMGFELDLKRLPADYSLAQVVSVPPRWMPGKGATPIAELQWHRQFNGDLDEKSAWVMLTELEKGYFPTLYYADWHNKRDRVSVALSATNFKDNYYQFLDCIDNLLPYSFDDISYAQLHFEKNSSKLDKASRNKLAQIEEYLKHDKDIEFISVKAYSSSWGGRYTNLKMSEKRAMMLKQFFVDLGVVQDKIETEGFGEKRHIASNQNELGRGENRRVVIELIKP
ncbi:OmpA family protein [Psychrosphaera sp. 1_MG-2023]|uniref:flagellar protein MotY n=1 Tax=Psychrosphaera sp. 1_MG-2023 TaxID=3062643 RepID=UPI0026E12CC5|nr:OmpA family protein [Psychrosphaera sp. 1_MG-2023]MDO6720542.1 OmpA family protein [Psychrosphaera sp. 1_MG-2023]